MARRRYHAPSLGSAVRQAREDAQPSDVELAARGGRTLGSLTRKEAAARAGTTVARAEHLEGYGSKAREAAVYLDAVRPRRAPWTVGVCGLLWSAIGTKAKTKDPPETA